VRTVRPNIAKAKLAALLLRDVLSLRVNEAPHFIDLDSLRRNALNVRIVIGRTGRSSVYDQLENRILGAVEQSAGSANGKAFTQASQNPGAVVDGQLVHVRNYACSDGIVKDDGLR
jgi:hypothetical protein